MFSKYKDLLKILTLWGQFILLSFVCFLVLEFCRARDMKVGSVPAHLNPSRSHMTCQRKWHCMFDFRFCLLTAGIQDSRTVIDFCTLTVPCSLAVITQQWQKFSCQLYGIFYIEEHYICKQRQDGFISLFPNCIPFISLSYCISQYFQSDFEKK